MNRWNNIGQIPKFWIYFPTDFSALVWRGTTTVYSKGYVYSLSHNISGDEGKRFTGMACEVEIKEQSKLSSVPQMQRSHPRFPHHPTCPAGVVLQDFPWASVAAITVFGL